jgi:hypothetical protein
MTAEPNHRREEIEAIKLALELFAGPEVIRGHAEDGGWVMQFAPPVEIALWYGPGQTLERWRAGAESTWRDVTFGAEERWALCGADARRLEAQIPAGEAAEGAFPAPDGGLEFRPSAPPPATAVVVVGFEHRGTPVLLSWTVESARREELRAAEERFFAALECW